MHVILSRFGIKLLYWKFRKIQKKAEIFMWDIECMMREGTKRILMGKTFLDGARSLMSG